MGKYDRWRRIFSDAVEDSFSLDFTQLEQALGEALPASARRHKAWWAPSQLAAVWSEYGYIVRVDLDKEVATFRRRVEPPTQDGESARRDSPAKRSAIATVNELAAVIPGSPDNWHCVDLWNAAIASEFFAERWADRPVYLDVETETLDRLAAQAGISDEHAETHLLRCVRKTLHAAIDGVATFSAHVGRTRRWAQGERIDPPPCLAVLAVLVLAAEKMRADADMASNNYLGRLTQLLEIDDQHRDKLYRDFTRQTHELWAALNSWIQEGEGTRGIPTAKAFDRRVHVGIPISQALIKEADRQRLWPMFARYQLEAGQNMAPSDMRRILADWLPHSAMSPYVKHLWSQGADQQTRIAEVAAVELQAWDGRVPRVGHAKPAGTLRLAARVSRFPSERFDLWLVTDADLESTSGPFRPALDAVQLAAILAGDDPSLQISQGVGRWANVGSDGDLSIIDLMSVAVDLRSAAGASIRRNPKAIVVMGYDDDYGFFVEQDRAQLGRDLLILAYGAQAQEVEQVLLAAARPGYAHLAEGVEGLPDSWTVFTDVQLVSIPETESPDLAALVPLAWNEASFGGGFRLPGPQTWHRLHPPELRLSALDVDNVGIELECGQRLDGDPGESWALGEIDGSGMMDTLGLDLVDGDYTVRLVKITPAGGTGQSIVTNSFRLRSGDYPRPIDGGSPWPARRDVGVGAGWAAVSATHSDIDGNVCGANVRLPVAPGETEDLPAAPATLEIKRGAWVPEDDRGPAQQHRRRIAASATCAIGTGAHHWMLPLILPEDPPAKEDEGHCKYCGLRNWFPRRPRPRRRISPRATWSANTEFSARRVTVEPIHQSIDVDHDLLLDALSYARSGSWDSFIRLARPVDEAPWFPIEQATLLEALGHIELLRSMTSLAVEAWTTTPPALMALGDGKAVLCGRRSGRIISTLSELGAALGGRVATVAQPNAPSIVQIRGFDARDVEGLAELLSEQIDTRVSAVVAASERLTKHLPPLHRVAEALPRFTPLDAPTYRFSYRSNQWEATTGITEVGAYRFVTRPVTYGVFTGRRDMKLIRADNRWSKWIGGLATGSTPLAYDASMRTLIVPLGARLPGLYERAAVLASGRPPSDMADGTTRYHDVPVEIANQLWQLLSTKPDTQAWSAR